MVSCIFIIHLSWEKVLRSKGNIHTDKDLVFSQRKYFKVLKRCTFTNMKFYLENINTFLINV